MLTPMQRPWPYPRLIAHRGGAQVAPENTLPAFAEAAQRGYRCCECDVALTADGVPVLLHDATLGRTAGSPARLADTTRAQLAGLDAGSWFHPRFAGTRIPSLEEAIACWLRLGQQAMIELKTGDGQDATRVGAVVASTVRRCWRGDPPMFISFSEEALRAAAGAAPAIPRALLLDGSWPADWRERAIALGCSALDVEHPLAGPDRIAAVHAAGLHLLVWTVNDPGRAAELLAAGVDAVTTDAIDRINP